MGRITAPDDDDDGGSSSPPPPPSPAIPWGTHKPGPPYESPVFPFKCSGFPPSPSPPPPPPSSSSERPPLQWVPLDKHLAFRSAQDSGSEAPRDGRRSSNLLAWDADSSRLYAWDPFAGHVLCFSLRFREPEPNSSASSSSIVEAAIPPENHNASYRIYQALATFLKVLLPDILIEAAVDNISLSVDGESLLLASSDSLRVMFLYSNSSATDQRTRRTTTVASQIFSGPQNGLQILQASWHPYAGRHMGILSSDSVFRLFNLSSDIERPEQEYYLQPAESGRCQKASSFYPVAFSFGDKHLWDRFSIFIVFSDGSVYALCPIVPFGSIYRLSHIQEIYEDINVFGLNSSDSKSVSNSRLAIAWLEATFPELADQSVEGGSTLVLKAYPYAPIDASLLLQGPLTKVYFREENNNSEVKRNVEGEGKVDGFLYRSIGKDSILVISWSSGQLHIDALADELQPQWNVGTSPRLHVDFYGRVKGIAMICDSSSGEVPTSKLYPLPSNTSAGDITNLGHSPPLLRLAVVDLSLPQNVLDSWPLSLFPDPLLNQRFYCLHGGGIDLIALKFLPFTDLNPDRSMIGKPPSIYPILNTCSSESCSSVLFGFITISDLYGSSQIVSLSSSYEFIVLEMKAWNELQHLPYDSDDRSFIDVENSSSDMISKELLTGPRTITIPSAPSLRTLSADAIEGRSILQHYKKLFHETYLQYAHKVSIELREHADYLETVIKNQSKRLDEVKQSISKIDAKETDIKNRIARAVKVYELLDQRLENFRNLPAENKTPLSRAEREFKAELDRFADVELDALRSTIQALSARMKRLYQSSPANKANAPRETARVHKHASGTQLSQLKSSLEKLSILNKENSKKVKLIEHGLKNRES